MLKEEIRSVLAVGVDTVSIANSAKEAGFKVYAAGYFDDVDLKRVCIGSEAIVEQRPGKSCGRMNLKSAPEALLKSAESLIRKHEIDAVLLSSGLDDFPNILRSLNDLCPIIGSSPEAIQKVREKPKFFQELSRLGITHPPTTIAENIDEVRTVALELGYPVILKPVKSFGGVGTRVAVNSREIGRAFFEASLYDENLIVQKFVHGIHASISFIASNKTVKALTINEQLLGSRFLFQPEPFGYCGNIVPLQKADSIFQDCERIAEKITSHFGLKGSNGIDLVISKEGTPYIVEVNPRFQGTLECVEKVLRMNLVRSHIEACLHGSLPTIPKRASTFCTRLILYAPKRIFAPDLTLYEEVRDIPVPGTIIENGEPLCSIVTEGKSRKQSLRKGEKLAESIYRTLLQT